MSKLLNKPVTVHEVAGRPARLCVGKTDHRLTSLLDHWRETGCWWEGEAEKEFYEVEAGGRYVLYREDTQWTLHTGED